uniref:Uncharacterized protein n=1 Tax=Heterorhabditis bacteriophora TaxID=37862 RepID=A0A1I7WWJ1_HETBA
MFYTRSRTDKEDLEQAESLND